MKYSCIIFLVFVAMLLMRCTTHKKIAYNIPSNYSKEQKAEFLEKMDKGEALYKVHCGDCHGIFTKGNDRVPDFTHQQVDNYSAGFLRGDPKNHAVAMKMSPDQFLSIMSFLSSRKVDTTLRKVNVPVKPVVEF